MSVSRERPGPSEASPELGALVRLCHHGWSLAVLAHLGPGGPGRISELAYALDAPRSSVRPAVDALVALGLVARTSRHAHPLSPELLPTELGERVRPLAARLVDGLETLGVEDAARRKWFLPVLAAVGSSEGGRASFGELRRALAAVTDRALTHALRRLVDRGLATRSVSAGPPPGVAYGLTRSGAGLHGPVVVLAAALADALADASADALARAPTAAPADPSADATGS